MPLYQSKIFDGNECPEKNIPAAFVESENMPKHFNKRLYQSPAEIKNPDEDVLSVRQEEKIKEIGHGITKPLYIELKDDGRGIFKDKGWERERAAYLIDQFLGLELIPPTVIRQVSGKLGSMQRFISDAKTGNETDMSDADNFVAEHRSDLMKLWLLDVIIDNNDRHAGNFLIKNSRVYAIDHGFSLNHNAVKGMREYYDFRETIDLLCGWKSFLGEILPPEIVEQMKKFLENTMGQKILQELLTELIGEDIAATCLTRINFVAKTIIEKGMLGDEMQDYLMIT